MGERTVRTEAPTIPAVPARGGGRAAGSLARHGAPRAAAPRGRDVAAARRCSWPGCSGSSPSGNIPARRGSPGWLAPEQGLIQIVAPQSGVLTQVTAQEGLEVAAGTPLAVLSAERRCEVFGRDAGRGAAPAPGAARQPDRRAGPAPGALRGADAAQAGAARGDRGRARRAGAGGRAAAGARRRSPSAALARQRELRDRDIATEQNLLRGGAGRARPGGGAAGARAQAHDARAQPARARGRARRGAAARGDCSSPRSTAQVAALDQALAEAEAEREIVIAAPQAGT